ncbi:hypothetical protein E2C01_025997 [Portunus trituberculatus]|uniref:Uncharacterized protein n=1 Tax=Portunus trituberculatus TaxID=210409 RepID=A0A5B7EEX4_PORTR|nr:hypothetical protein [Portunus trituberculatus]
MYSRVTAPRKLQVEESRSELQQDGETQPHQGKNISTNIISQSHDHILTYGLSGCLSVCNLKE